MDFANKLEKHYGFVIWIIYDVIDHVMCEDVHIEIHVEHP